MDYHIDVIPVVVQIELEQEYEKEIEEKMLIACKDMEFLDHHAFCIRRFNLKRVDSLLGKPQKEIRTYFCDQFGIGKRRPLYRFNKHGTLCHAGTQIRRGAGQYQYDIFTDMQPYKPAPTFDELRVPEYDKIKRIKLNQDENIIECHPFTEKQMKLTYGHLNDYSRAYTKAHKMATRGNVNLAVRLHDIDHSYDGLLLRIFTPSEVHYFPIQWNTKGHTAKVTIGSMEDIVWKPRVHMQFLKNYLHIQ